MSPHSNSPSQDYTYPDDHTLRTYDMIPAFKLFTNYLPVCKGCLLITHSPHLPSSFQSSSSFSFLSQETEHDAGLTAAEDSRVGSAEEIMKYPWQTTAKLPYDSSGDDDDDDDGDDMHVEDTDGDQSSKSTSHLDELFFFHPDDSELANRINGELLLLEYRVRLLECRL